MGTRLDLALTKHPEHEAGIRLLATRDPSGNLKYLDWGTRMLVSGQALAPEIADVLDLYHRFSGRTFGRRSRDRERIHPDIYTYRPQDLAGLRDKLLKLKRAQDRKRRARERLYRIDGSVEADVIYEAPDLVVRHIKNKQASLHYGLNTKWCISMRRENYFNDYESHNATFFFFERTSMSRLGDEFDKVALMVPRSGHDGGTIDAFTSIDRRVDMMALAKVYGTRVFDIFREIYERSERYPGSVMFQVYAGIATQEQLESVYASVANRSLSAYETDAILESICCNDAAPSSLLEEIAVHGYAISFAVWKKHLGVRRPRRARRRRHRLEPKTASTALGRTIMAALVIHQNVPPKLREKLSKELRKRHVDVAKIHRINDGSRVAVSFLEHRAVRYVRRRRGYRIRRLPLSELRRRVGMFERTVVRAKKAVKKKELEIKIAAAKKAKSAKVKKPK